VTSRHQLGPLLVAALFGAAATTACLQPPSNSAATLLAAPEVSPPPSIPRVPPEFESPASVHEDVQAEGSSGLPAVNVTTPDAGGLPPDRALEAYQRASTAMDDADPDCGLSWPLLAAIGSIESDHGRVGGRVMSPGGVAHPPILGPRLDGTASTARLSDTDQGTLDGDTAFDRAVGPMQLIPSTWAVVAVDGDADGVRDPQDIDDASLAAAVYLCAWHDDLSTDGGRRTAVHRYNRSSSYVDQVLRAMAEYAGSAASAFVTGLLSGGAPPTLVEVEAEPGPPGAELTWSAVTDSVWGAVPSTVWVSGPTITWTDPVPTPTSSPAPATPPSLEPDPQPTTDPTTDPSTDPTPDPSTDPTTDPGTDPTPHEPEPSPASSTPVRAAQPTVEPQTTPPVPDRSPPGEDTASAAPDPGSPTSPPIRSVAPAPEGVETPEGLSQAESQAWSGCVTAPVASTNEARLAACLAQALGLPPENPRLIWLLALLPGRENE
jgi:membrane-bound lytic murein transglycosylase B